MSETEYIKFLPIFIACDDVPYSFLGIGVMLLIKLHVKIQKNDSKEFKMFLAYKK